MKALAFILAFGLFAQKDDPDFFKRWLSEDVVYIITKDELASARGLKTPEEKDAFIQTFWERRDPTRGTMANEYREEHYLRIAKANQKYTTATDGWRTDRGKILIRFGEPDNIDRNDSAGSTTMRSGANRLTVPFETWEYRNIPGIGPAKITFVDKTMTGNYEMTLNPADKIAKFSNEDSALLNSDPNNLLTLTETPDSIDWSKRVNQYLALQRPPEIKFKDLKALVNVRLAFNVLPFNVRLDTLRGAGDRSVVPVTFEFDRSGLTFEQGPGGRVATVNVYCIVVDLAGRVAYEFEDAVSLYDSTYFQRFITLDPGRYKVTAVAKQAGSGSAGKVEQVIAVSRPQNKLGVSSLMLADILVATASNESTLDNFVISRFKVRPLVKPEISSETPLGIYQEIYDFATDSNSQKPDIGAVLQVFRKGQGTEVLNSLVTAEEIGTRYAGRLLLAKTLRVSGLAPGEYIVRLTVTDNLRKETLATEAPLTLKN